jgi:CHAT domain-containing protein
MLRLTLFLAVLPILLNAVEIQASRTWTLRWHPGENDLELQAKISAGKALRLSLDQGDNDLAVDVKMPDGRNLRFDEFEFGVEKVTLTSEVTGVVQLGVTPVGGALKATTFVVSLQTTGKSSSVDESEIAAETLATNAKTQSTIASDDPESLALLKASLETWQRMGEWSAVARTRLACGDWHYRHADMEKARADYRSAIGECGSYLRCRVEAVNNSGSASRNLGDIDEASLELSEAAGGWKKLHAPQMEARTYSNLGLLHLQTSEFDLALKDFTLARQLLVSSDTPFIATVLNNIGLVYLSSERYDAAILYFNQALRLTSRYPDTQRTQGRIRVNLGRSRMFAGRLAQAERNEVTALQLASDANDVSAKADALDNLGQIRFRLRDFPSASNDFHEALQLYQKIGYPLGLSSTLFFLGLLDANRGDYTDARTKLDQALQIRLARHLDVEAAETFYQLALLEKKRENVDASLTFARKAVEMAQTLRIHAAGEYSRVTLFAARRKYFEYLVDETLDRTGIRKEAIERAFRVVEQARARTLADTLGALPPRTQNQSPLSAERRAIQRQVAFKSERLALIAVNQQQETAVLAIRRDIENLLLRDEQLAASSSPLTHLRNHPFEPRGISDLQALLLNPGDVFLEFWLGERRSFLWIIRHSSASVRELPARKRIEGHTAYLLSLLADINGRRADPTREASFESATRQLSRDLNIVIGGSAPTRIFIVADGALNGVPFAMLPFQIQSAHGSRQLIGPMGQVALVMQPPSATIFIALNHPGEDHVRVNSALAFGDPVYSSNDDRLLLPKGSRRISREVSGLELSRLVFSRMELQTLAELVTPAKRRLFSGFNATRQHFLSATQGATGLVLVSTHVLADNDQPELSSIVLSMIDHAGRPVDGLVHLYDLDNGALKLNSALVVLSTCDGATGREIDLEGLQSLARGFILIGARSVVASVAKVDSEAAAHFVCAFLKSLLAPGGNEPAAALKTARQAMLASRWKDPYYWSTFALFGGE